MKKILKVVLMIVSVCYAPIIIIGNILNIIGVLIAASGNILSLDIYTARDLIRDINKVNFLDN